jgi:hypothetical protein
MKKILLLIVLMAPMIIWAQTPVPPGPVSGTWVLAGSPYMVNGEIYIDETATLEIEPGVEVRFKGWYKFIVNGSLKAIGTKTDSIRFTANDTSNRWHGIKFIETSDTSILNFCILEYGLTILDNLPQSFPDNAGAGILFTNVPDAYITIKNSSFYNNIAYLGGGIGIIYCNNCNPIIDSCRFIGNKAPGGGNGGGIYCLGGSPIIKNSEFKNNFAGHRGGGFGSWMGTPTISASIFINNTSENVGGAIMVGVTQDFNINNCLIANNTAAVGGGLYMTEADGDCINNTIAYNNATNAGGGICFYGEGASQENLLVKNCNINYNEAPEYSAGHQVYLITDESDPDFWFSNIQGGLDGFGGIGSGTNFTGDYENCIDGDPLFADPVNHDYNITWENYPWVDSTRSPCIDSGNSFFLDPDGTIIDIGAYSFFQQLDVPEALPGISISGTSFIAVWTEAFGALGYYLDLAEDYTFTSFVLENQEVYDTEFLVEGLLPSTEYFYRVRSFNTALTSDYSNFMNNPHAIGELGSEEVEIYAFNNRLFVKTMQNNNNAGNIWVYNTAGQLLANQQIYPGSNTIDLKLSDQIIIVKVIIEEKVYQQKLLVK